MPKMPPTVAFIGLGAMGLPMAARLATAFPVTAFDISPERRTLAAQRGATPADSPAHASRDADVVVLAVRDGDQAQSSLFGADGVVDTLRSGGVVILCSTIGPDAAREIAEQLSAHGILLVDAPISGGPVRAGNADLLIVVGAEDKALTQAKAVLDRLASTLTVVGPRPGDGQAFKSINQLLAGVHIAAAAEAVALARGLGLDPEIVVNTLAQGAAGSFMLSDRGPRMLQAYSDSPEVKSRVDIFVKDMGIVSSVARDAHVPVPLAAAAHQLYLLAEAAGLGACDDSTIVTVLSPTAKES
jgi:3-hydroxyisobutyrate dehydrogenase